MKVYKWILCVVLVFAICFCVISFGGFRSEDSSLQRASETAPAQEPVVTEFSFSSDTYNERLLIMLNAYRERMGLGKWTPDDKLTAAASTRATECSILESKSHVRPDGTEWYTALGISENYNYSEITGISGQSAEEMIRTWVGAESINSSILNPEYTACGLDCEAIGSNVYCVLILYKP